MRRVIYHPEIEKLTTRRMPLNTSYEELRNFKPQNEEIIAIFDLRGQRGYTILRMHNSKDYHWYLSTVRGDRREPEKFFWFINKRWLR